MGRHQRWISREPFDEEVASWGSPPVGWGFAKAVLVCGLAGGVLGSSIGAALGTTGHAGLAAMIGGIPPAVIGACALGWYGSLFAAINRIRFGRLVGVVLGFLLGGLLGTIA